MKIHRLSGPPSTELATALAGFERPFTYPLGTGGFFRISHGADYTLFFRAQGTAACFIAEDRGRVVGALGTAIKRFWFPDGTEREVAYFGDLKISQDSRGGLVLTRLARAAEAWLRPKVQAGFGVVMGGTSLTPGAYTGRAGIPAFRELGRLTILRISGNREEMDVGKQMIATRESGLTCFRRLSRGRYASPVGESTERSEITPEWLLTPDGAACGMLEDTRKAKRLISDDGSEMLSAHLSCFAYCEISAAVNLINAAFARALRLGFPAMFVAVAETAADDMRAALSDFTVRPASATVYGAGLKAGSWNINTAEI